MRVGAIDIGSNSVRLLTVGADGEELRREVAVTGLASGVDRSRRLSEPAVARTLDVLEAFAAWLELDEVDTVGAVATSACRDAANGARVMARIEQVLGVRPSIISGQREAELAFLGVAAARRAGGQLTVIDVGGGSTEVISGSDAIEWSCSYDIGSVRLTDRVLPMRPAIAGDLAVARAEADAIFADPMPPVRSGDVVGVAGSFTSLAAITLQLETYDRDQVHGSILTTAQVAGLISTLATRSVEETAAIPSLDPRRAPVILAGALVVAAAMGAVGADRVTVSEHDLLDGLAAAVRESSVG